MWDLCVLGNIPVPHKSQLLYIGSVWNGGAPSSNLGGNRDMFGGEARQGGMA